MLAQLIGLGGSLIGMSESRAAAKRAAAAAQAAAEARVAGLHNAIEERRLGTGRAIGYLRELSPFADMGLGAYGQLSAALGLSGKDAQQSYFDNFQLDPGFLASQKAGTNAIEQSQAGGGLLRSGGTLKSLYDYGQKNLLGLHADRLNRMAGLGAAGQQAATTMATGSAGIEDSSTNTIANYLRDVGEANAGGIIGGSNADQRGTQNWLSMLGYGIGQMKGGINDLFGFGGGGFGGLMKHGTNPFDGRGGINPLYA